MVAEKQLAFAQSWIAMIREVTRQQQVLALSLLTGSTGRKPTPADAMHALSRVAGAGIAPVHRKAVANAKRLARTKLR
jgi:hypothetical protein